MAKPKKEQLARYAELRTRKSKLESDARALESEIDLLADLITTHLEDIGKNDAKIHGFRVTLSEGLAYPKWKNHYILAQGAEAAQEVIANTPRNPKLTVIPPEPKTKA
ncbi:hypothetical protein [Aureliella helgolandensis]|uniref:Uncharacterized protein n=1 Tax=Aureliella helgolandensis TaxID=2527968 RepID=A0A518GDR0_9BACT|nr:hypothetical protein [Aureliella helgolandensis]QDV26739.1 hypothetical protein Q31a_51180 [Aureliella helgolandensis]